MNHQEIILKGDVQRSEPLRKARSPWFTFVNAMNLSRRGSNVVQLMDGGFYHNNPIKAAVELGATHIIVIRSSPPVTYQEIGSTLLENVNGIIHLLLNRAETEDYQAALRIPTYLITPRPEDTDKHLTVFDFDGRYDFSGIGTPKSPSVTLTDYARYGSELAFDRNWGFIEPSKLLKRLFRSDGDCSGDGGDAIEILYTGFDGDGIISETHSSKAPTIAERKGKCFWVSQTGKNI